MGVLSQLLSTRCSAPCSACLWPSPWSCCSRCPLPPALTPSPLPPAPPPSSPSLLPSPLPLLPLDSWASRPSSLQLHSPGGEERGLQRRRRCPPLRPLPPLRLRTATRGSSALPALAKWRIPRSECAGPLQPRPVHEGSPLPQGHEVCGGCQVRRAPQERGQVRAQVPLQPRHGRSQGLVLNGGAEIGSKLFRV